MSSPLERPGQVVQPTHESTPLVPQLDEEPAPLSPEVNLQEEVSWLNRTFNTEYARWRYDTINPSDTIITFTEKEVSRAALAKYASDMKRYGWQVESDADTHPDPVPTWVTISELQYRHKAKSDQIDTAA